LATTDLALFMVTVQTLSATVSQPVQPLKREPRSAVAVSVTIVTVLYVAEQLGPQLIPPGLEVTVPLPSPNGPDVFLTVRIAVTVKLPALVAVPAAVVTVSFPVVAPVGTIAWIAVADVTAKFVALTPLNFTAVAPVKFKPLIVTTVPTGPMAGVKLVILGATVKGAALVAVPPGVVTLSGPVVAPAGTAA
jgi:hypothetical protein